MLSGAKHLLAGYEMLRSAQHDKSNIVEVITRCLFAACLKSDTSRFLTTDLLLKFGPEM